MFSLTRERGFHALVKLEFCNYFLVENEKDRGEER